METWKAQSDGGQQQELRHTIAFHQDREILRLRSYSDPATETMLTSLLEYPKRPGPMNNYYSCISSSFEMNAFAKILVFTILMQINRSCHLFLQNNGDTELQQQEDEHSIGLIPKLL